MHFRYPINLISDNLEDTVQSISVLLGASEVKSKIEGTKLEDINFIGPYNLVKDLYARQNDFDKKSLRFIIDEETKNKRADQDKKTIANGVYLSKDYSGNFPFLMFYKMFDALGGKPVLVSENYLIPGELVVVPESSEYFAVLLFDEQGQTADDIKWYCWLSEKENIEVSVKSKIKYKVNYDEDYSESDYRDGRLVKLKMPLLECSDIPTTLMNWDVPSIQIFPVLSDVDAEELLKELRACTAWVRRSGENNIIYTQESFDILEYSKNDDSPKIFRTVIEKLQSKQLLNIVSSLSGMELSSLLEVYSFHMKSNEFITRHADGTIGGQLLLRLNWLIQNPSSRKYDLRFWKGKNCETPVTRYKAVPNSATVFYVGEHTPHDITPLPENCDLDRYNIVFSFGHRTNTS